MSRTLRSAVAFAMVALLAIPGMVAAGSPGGVVGRLWDDVDRDGIQDGAEKRGVSGLTVQLLSHPGDGLVGTTTSASDGTYRLVPPSTGEYRVRVMLPASIEMTVAVRDVSDDRVDSDFSRYGGTEPVTVGADDVDLDGGVRLQVITAKLFLDRNGDHKAQPDEPLLSGVQVQLLMAIDLSTVVASARADDLGTIRFVIPFARLDNSFRVRVVMPPGYARNPEGGARAEDALDERSLTPVIDRGTALTFGLLMPVRMGDLVWNDRDLDGRQDPGEPGVPDVRIVLLDEDGESDFASTTTNANGRFTIVAPSPGRYTIWASLPDGARYSPMRSDLPEGVDSDVKAKGRAAGYSPVFTLVRDGHRKTFDIGMKLP